MHTHFKLKLEQIRGFMYGNGTNRKLTFTNWVTNSAGRLEKSFNFDLGNSISNSFDLLILIRGVHIHNLSMMVASEIELASDYLYLQWFSNVIHSHIYTISMKPCG